MQLEADGMAPLWSPDGASLAFTSRAGLDLHVRTDAGTAHAKPLFSDQVVKVLNDWSLDTQQIVYTRHDTGTKLDLWQLPLSGGASRPLLKTSSNEVQARLSPDGRWIAYASDASGTQEVYVRRYPHLDEPHLISTRGGGQPQWRADQKELFYLAADRSLMAVTMAGAEHLTFGAPRRLFRASIRDSPSGARDSYAAMPDGRSFLIDARSDTAPPIAVMLQWANGLAHTAPSDGGRPVESVALR
jgi:dipeptidyl aminopeptidase/acylaminoacyl peptidase